MHTPLANVPDLRPDSAHARSYQVHALPQPPIDLNEFPEPKVDFVEPLRIGDDIADKDMSTERNMSTDRNRPKESIIRDPSPIRRDPSPIRRELTQSRRETNRDVSPTRASIRFEVAQPESLRRESSPHREKSPTRDKSPVRSPARPLPEPKEENRTTLGTLFPNVKLEKSHMITFTCGALFGRMPLLAVLFLLGGVITVIIYLQSLKSTKPASASIKEPILHPLDAKPVLEREPRERPVDRTIQRRRRRLSRTVDEDYAFRPYD